MWVDYWGAKGYVAPPPSQIIGGAWPVMKNGPVFTFGDTMWVAVHILSRLAAKKETMFLKMTIWSSLSGSPLSNAI